MKDPYSVIGVSKKASATEIKRAYHTLAKELHPDLNPGDTSVEKQFKEVSAAYNLLSDKEQRAKFDRGEINADGSPAFSNPFHSSANANHRGRSGANFSFNQGRPGFDNLFSDLFGNNTSYRGSPARGRNLSFVLKVSLEDVAKGVIRRVKISREKVLDVKVPRGTMDGQVLRLKGQGESGSLGAPLGDALVTINLKKHQLFTLNGYDIHLQVPIGLDEAILGAKLTVPTLYGKVALNVPKNTSSGLKLRLRGKGLSPIGKKAGDQIVYLNVVLPESTDPALEAFARQWKGGEGDRIRRKLRISE